jgi:hypothetical protein
MGWGGGHGVNEEQRGVVAGEGGRMHRDDQTTTHSCMGEEVEGRPQARKGGLYLGVCKSAHANSQIHKKDEGWVMVGGDTAARAGGCHRVASPHLLPLGRYLPGLLLLHLHQLLAGALNILGPQAILLHRGGGGTGWHTITADISRVLVTHHSRHFPFPATPSRRCIPHRGSARHTHSAALLGHDPLSFAGKLFTSWCAYPHE